MAAFPIFGRGFRAGPGLLGPGERPSACRHAMVLGPAGGRCERASGPDVLHGLPAAVGAELLVQVPQVGLDSVGREVEFGAPIWVGRQRSARVSLSVSGSPGQGGSADGGAGLFAWPSRPASSEKSVGSVAACAARRSTSPSATRIRAGNSTRSGSAGLRSRSGAEHGGLLVAGRVGRDCFQQPERRCSQQMGPGQGAVADGCERGRGLLRVVVNEPRPLGG